MHLVHYNKKYDEFETALDKSDGLAVLGFFFTVNNAKISEFNIILFC